MISQRNVKANNYEFGGRWSAALGSKCWTCLACTHACVRACMRSMPPAVPLMFVAMEKGKGAHAAIPFSIRSPLWVSSIIVRSEWKSHLICIDDCRNNLSRMKIKEFVGEQERKERCNSQSRITREFLFKSTSPSLSFRCFVSYGTVIIINHHITWSTRYTQTHVGVSFTNNCWRQRLWEQPRANISSRRALQLNVVN